MKKYLLASITSISILCGFGTAKGQNFFVAEYSGNRITEITPGGTESTFASGLNEPIGVAFDAVGNLFESDGGSGNIYKFTPGGVQSTFISGLYNPTGVVFDKAGNLYVGSILGGNIIKITSGGMKSTFASGLPGPNQMAFDSSSNLFVANYFGGSVTKITPAGVTSTFASGLPRASGLAIDGAGNVFVSVVDGTVRKFTPGGVQSTFAMGLNNPSGMTFDSAGNLYVVNAAPAPNGFITRITPGGTQSTFASGLNGPWGLTAQLSSPPTITCPEPLTLECTNGMGVGTLTATVSSASGLPLEVTWTVDGIAYQTNDIPAGGTNISSDVTLTAIFGEGEHTVVVSVSDGQNPAASCSTSVTVSDTLPPQVLDISTTPDLLWPPNHKMVPVSVSIQAVDNCDPSPVAQITQVTCNEPPEHFTPDWIITGPLSVDLRSERLGNSERIYTIYVDVTDSSSNKTTTTTTVIVPKSMSVVR